MMIQEMIVGYFPAGIKFLALRRLRVYTRLPPVEPSEHNVLSQRVPQAPSRPSTGLQTSARWQTTSVSGDFSPAAFTLNWLIFIMLGRVASPCQGVTGHGPSYRARPQDKNVAATITLE